MVCPENLDFQKPPDEEQ